MNYKQTIIKNIMNIKSNELTDIIYKFITEENIISFKRLKKNFDNYITGLAYHKEDSDYINYPSFYSIIDSLLCLGYIEFGCINNKQIFFIPKSNILKNNNVYYKKSDCQPIFLPFSESNQFIELNPLKLLRSMQSIVTVCNNLEDSNQRRYLFQYNSTDKKISQYDYNNEKYQVGIYKLQLFSESELVSNNGKHKKIKRKSDYYDELNYCFSYVDIFYKKKIFIYNKNKQELQILSTNIPILIKRALYMCDINNFTVHPYYIMENSIFKNINEEITKELIRIFSLYNLEVIND